MIAAITSARVSFSSASSSSSSYHELSDYTLSIFTCSLVLTELVVLAFVLVVTFAPSSAPPVDVCSALSFCLLASVIVVAASVVDVDDDIVVVLLCEVDLSLVLVVLARVLNCFLTGLRGMTLRTEYTPGEVYVHVNNRGNC